MDPSHPAAEDKWEPAFRDDRDVVRLPGTGEVHLWRIRFSLDWPLVELEPLLSPEERERAGRYHFKEDRRAFVIGRAALRSLLGGYVGLDPSEVTFSYGAHGKPELAGNTAGLRFNLSHSGDLALCAVTTAAAVGVDVERLDRRVRPLELASRYFAPGEAAVLRSLPEGEQRDAFFRCWTRKEAYMKARGEGISLGLGSFEVTLAPDDPPAVLRCDTDPAAVRSWKLLHLEPGDGYQGALAVAADVASVRYLDLHP